MFSDSDIMARAWMVREIVDLVMQQSDLHVDRIYLIGSYAMGTQNIYSDIDYLVQLNNPMRFPNWHQIQEIHTRLLGALSTERVHVIFGSREVQESLKKPYKEIQLPGGQNVAHQPST